MAGKKNSALVPMNEFRLMLPYENMDPELRAELEEQLEDLDADQGIDCRLIKIPSGGKLAYEVQGEDADDPDYEKEVEGVIIFTHRVNAYWPEAYGSGQNGNQAPACSSMDGKTGVWRDTGEVCDCKNCPHNQFGSDPKGGGGKACKNMRRVYLMMQNDPGVYRLTVPPTSIRDVEKYLNRIMRTSQLPFTSMVVGFGLARDKNKNGVDYSKVTLERKGILPDNAAAAARELRRQLKEKFEAMTITADDYNAPELQAPSGGFIDITPDDDDLPFTD